MCGLTRGWTCRALGGPSACAAPSGVAPDKESYVCVLRAGRPQVNRRSLGREGNLAHRHPDLTCFRWFIGLNPNTYRQAEQTINAVCIPALAAARSAVKVESAYLSKHLDQGNVWLTIFASLGDSGPLVNAVAPSLSGLPVQQQVISDLAREELLQSHCDSFRSALDLVTHVALDIHTATALPDHQRALVTVGVGGRTDRAQLESYLMPRSVTFASDPAAFLSILRCNCLTGQQTDAVHWLYNVVLGFDWDWGRGQASILQELGL